jgi:ABC-type multidrug transport system fused ATPase/permease subunit
MDKRSRMIGYAGNIFSIMDVVKIFGIEDKVVERFSASADQLRQVGEERSRMGAWYRVFLNSLGEFSTKILITALGCLGLFFFGQPSVGTIMAMQSYAAGYKGAIQGMSQARVSYADADGGSQRVLDILAMRPEIADAPSAESLGPLHGRIEFKDVSFSYDEKAPVLEHVSFAIEPGQVVAFVGATGSGKSTLMKLMARLHDPTAGSVSVDGRDLKNVRLASLTSQLAVVPQGGGLFKGTIRENLMAVQPNATDKEINEAIDAAQAQFIRDSAGYPHGLDTDIDMLSGGEAQRIAIVRAMLRNPKILFLDEATSALDNKTESLVQQAIDGLMKGRTTVMVAHRLSTIEKADKIFVLDKGRIVESGTHQELMALKGKYYELAATGSK